MLGFQAGWQEGLGSINAYPKLLDLTAANAVKSDGLSLTAAFKEAMGYQVRPTGSGVGVAAAFGADPQANWGPALKRWVQTRFGVATDDGILSVLQEVIPIMASYGRQRALSDPNWKLPATAANFGSVSAQLDQLYMAATGDMGGCGGGGYQQAALPVAGSLAARIGGILGGGAAAGAGMAAGEAMMTGPGSLEGVEVRRGTFQVMGPDGRPRWYRHQGRPILWSGDLAAVRRVERVAKRAARVAGYVTRRRGSGHTHRHTHRRR